MSKRVTRQQTQRLANRVVSGGNDVQIEHTAPAIGFPVSESANVATECAFGVKPLPGGVCSLPRDLDRMKEFYTKHSASNPPISPASLQQPRTVVQSLKAALKCTTESCIYESPEYQNFVGKLEAERILHERFLPAGPRNSTRLLSNHHIENVMKQFTVEFPDFVHIPFQMIDFAEQNTELAHMDLQPYLKDGYRRFGCVLNTDTSEGSGKHWFCLFMDFSALSKKDLYECVARKPTMLRITDRCTIEYFNSSGNPARPQVERFCEDKQKTLREQFPGLNVWTVQSSHLRHQYSHTECGVYALFYIWQRLQKHPYTDFSRYWIPDQQIINQRKTFFREPNATQRL